MYKKGFQKLHKWQFLTKKVVLWQKKANKIIKNGPRDTQLGLKLFLESPFDEQSCSLSSPSPGHKGANCLNFLYPVWNYSKAL